jgi:hypothetical protein
MNLNVLVTREMPERHTSDNLADKLKSIVSEFHLCGKITDVVHDNARNMVSDDNNVQTGMMLGVLRTRCNFV